MEQHPKFEYTHDQAAVINSNHTRICVFACAGSGKTFTITNRIARLINDDGVDPSRIAAITFTNLATDSLKINLVKYLANPQIVSRIFIGTIHSFCLNLLKENEGFSLQEKQILSQSQQFIICSQNFDDWGIGEIADLPKSMLIGSFLSTVGIMKMESISKAKLVERHPEIVNSFQHYQEYLETNLRWDYSDLIAKMLHLMHTDEEFLTSLYKNYDYLFVDEYQDVDPLQSEIVNIAAEGINTCVVGDDDQSIYQFRGTDVENILSFANDPRTKTFSLETNRRCPTNILRTAENCILKVQTRQSKKMSPLNDEGKVESHFFNHISEEYDFIVRKILDLKKQGEIEFFSEVAILMRSVASYGQAYIEALKDNSIPVIVMGGRNLFQNDVIQQIVGILNWLILEDTLVDSLQKLNHTFNLTYPISEPERELGDLSTTDLEHLGLDESDSRLLESLLRLKEKYQTSKFGSILEIVNIIIIDLNLINTTVPEDIQYHTAQLTSIAAEYDEVTDSKRLEKFCGFLSAYAERSYDENQPLSETKNSVNVITIHQAKGLEYKYVFVPMLVEKRFPVEASNSRWLIDGDLFDSARYLSTLDNERRLFYVAVTRAKSGLYLVGSKDVGLVRDKSPSKFFKEAKKFQLPSKNVPFIFKDEGIDNNKFLISSYSSLEYYLTCPYRYKLIKVTGLKTPTNPFFEFGKLIHFLVADINNQGLEANLVKINELYEESFEGIIANSNAPRLVLIKQKIRGKKALGNYFDNKSDWYLKIKSAEEDFEFAADNCLIRGRFDAISEVGDGTYHIIDIKTGSPHEYLRTDFQMQLYALAATKYLNIKVSKATLYYIEEDKDVSYDIDDKFLESASKNLMYIVNGILDEKFEATPGQMCVRCEVRSFCEFKQ